MLSLPVLVDPVTEPCVVSQAWMSWALIDIWVTVTLVYNPSAAYAPTQIIKFAPFVFWSWILKTLECLMPVGLQT